MKTIIKLSILGIVLLVCFASCTVEKRVYNRGLNVQVYAFQKRDFRETEIRKSKPERSKINPEAKDALTIDEESNTFIKRSNAPKEQNSIFGNKSLDVKIQHSKKLKKGKSFAYGENSSFAYTEEVKNDSFVDSEDIVHRAENNLKSISDRKFEPYSYLSLLVLLSLGSIGVSIDSVVIFALGALGSIVLTCMGLYWLIKSPEDWKLKFFSYLFVVLGFLAAFVSYAAIAWWGV